MNQNKQTNLLIWQNRWSGAQTIIMFATLIAAIFIGIKQNQINQNLVDLNFIPSVSIVYNQQSKNLEVYNRSDKNIYVGNFILYDKFSSEEKVTSNESRQIAPGDYYFFLCKQLPPILEKYLQEIGANGERFIPFDLHLLSLNQKKYIVKGLLFLDVINGNTNIYTQTISISPGTW